MGPAHKIFVRNFKLNDKCVWAYNNITAAGVKLS